MCVIKYDVYFTDVNVRILSSETYLIFAVSKLVKFHIFVTAAIDQIVVNRWSKKGM